MLEECGCLVYCFVWGHASAFINFVCLLFMSQDFDVT